MVDILLRHYELVVVLSPMLNQEQVSGTWGRIKDFISTRSGDITYEEQWGTRRLAYPIRKGSHQFLEGSYHLTRFSVDNPINQELHTFLRLDDEVLRSLVVTALPPGIEPETPAQKRAAAAEIAAAAAVVAEARAAEQAAAAAEAAAAEPPAEDQVAEVAVADAEVAAEPEEAAEEPVAVVEEAAEPEEAAEEPVAEAEVAEEPEETAEEPAAEAEEPEETAEEPAAEAEEPDKEDETEA